MPFGKEKAEKSKETEGGSYKKIRLSAAKDILDATTPQALDAALHEYFRACADEQDE